MSSIPSGAVAITFAPDRTQIDNFLAELRKGVTVPFNVGGGAPGGGQSSFLPGLTRPSSTGGYSASGGTGGAGSDANSRRVDQAWDRAMLAQQKAAEAAERRAQAQEDRERKAEQRERQRAQAPTRIRDSDLERATPIRDSDLVDEGGGGRGGSNRIFGLRTGRLAQYATAGFLVNEAARSVRAYQDYSNEMTLARTGTQRTQAEMGFADTVSGVPVVGQIAAIFTNPARLRAMQAMQGAEMGNRAVQAMLGTADLQQQTRTLTGSVPGIDRQIQQLRDESDAAKRRAAGEDDPAVRSQMNQQASALRLKNEAEIGDLNRQRQRAMDREQRSAAGLGAAVEGRFGVAAERDFNAQLEQRTDDAQPLGPAAQLQVWNNNRMRRAARDAEIRLRIREDDFDTRATGYLLQRNGLGAERERLEGQAEHDLAFAANNDEANAIRAKYASRSALATQQNQDNFRLDIGSIRARNESLDILVNGPGTPAERERASAVDAIKRRTQLAELQAFQDSGLTDAQKLAKATALGQGGALELGAMREDFLRGLKPQEVDITRTALQGAGTEDVKTVMENLQKAIDDLKNLPKDIADAIKALDALASD
jgi:hypothetical protein